jgi:hypothetical protein
MAGNAAAASGLAVAVLLVLAACGGAGSANTTVVTVTNVSTVTSAQTGTVTSGSSFAATRHYARFRMPSKNVGCIYEASSNFIRCDILSGLVPEPSKPCELDWTGFVIEATGPVQPECAGDTVYDVNAPTLEYGERWSRGGISCESLEAGLRCQNGAGHGFTLARGASTTF